MLLDIFIHFVIEEFEFDLAVVKFYGSMRVVVLDWCDALTARSSRKIFVTENRPS